MMSDVYNGKINRVRLEQVEKDLAEIKRAMEMRHKAFNEDIKRVEEKVADNLRAHHDTRVEVAKLKAEQRIFGVLTLALITTIIGLYLSGVSP